MDHRTFGETEDCKGCRFWSEMIAKCDGGGPVLAMCLNSKSKFSAEYKSGSGKCAAWASGEFGAVDEPGFDASVYEDAPAERHLSAVNVVQQAK